MADLTRPDYGQAWAGSGEKLAPDEGKMGVGWIQEMMPFQYENYLQGRQDDAILYLLQKGIPEYSNTQEYVANKSTVIYQGILYTATQTVTGVLPSDTNSWRRAGGPAVGLNGAVTIPAGGTGGTTAAEARTNLGIGSLAALDFSGANGILVKTGTTSVLPRTLVGTTDIITITNPDGVDGNPTINVGSNVARTNNDSSWTTRQGIRLPSGSSADRGLAVSGKIRYNTELNIFEGYNGTSWVSLGTVSAIEVTTRSGTGAQTVFTLNAAVLDANSTDVYIGGIWQNKGTYTVSGASITFSEAPVEGVENIQVISREVVEAGISAASQVSVEDVGGYYSSVTVEGVLQEIGGEYEVQETAISSLLDRVASLEAPVVNVV